MNTKKSRAKHIPGELAEAYVYPVTLTQAQKRDADKQLKAARAKVQSEMTAEDKLRSDILQLRFRLEDYLMKNLTPS